MGQQQANEEQVFEQVSNGNSEGIKSLRREGAGLEWVDSEGRTPLILACTNAKLYDVAKTLVELGSNVNAYCPGRNGGTPLHHAAKRGLENTVKLLLSHGANPLVDDGFQTPLEVARAKGYSNVVRAIESHICLFSGWMRQFYDPSFLGLFASQLLSTRVWVVILPTGSRNRTKPFKLKLVVYASLEDAKPSTEMDLWKANLEEPKSYESSDASVMITSPRPRKVRAGALVSHARRWAQVDRQMRLAAATIGDMQQLSWFCDACKGIPQPMNPPMFLETTSSAPKLSQNAINASLEPAMNEMPVLNHHASMANLDFISHELAPLATVDDESDGSIHYPSVDLTPPGISLGSGVCVICLNASSEAVCVPCGHVAGCMSCLKKIKDKKLGCPVCRATIDQVIKLYYV